MSAFVPGHDDNWELTWTTLNARREVEKFTLDSVTVTFEHTLVKYYFKRFVFCVGESKCN